MDPFCIQKVQPPLYIQIWLTFVITFLLSLWRVELYIFLVPLILYELALYSYSKYKHLPTNPRLRIAIVLSSILGWSCGRILLFLTCKFFGDDIHV